MTQTINPRKAAIIGCGFVGSATAFTLMQSRLFSELVLLDANEAKADGEAKDIAHGIPFAGQMKIYAEPMMTLPTPPSLSSPPEPIRNRAKQDWISSIKT